MQVTIEKLILTPRQLAEAFMEMCPDEQAEFFDGIADRTVTTGPFARWPTEASRIAECLGGNGIQVIEGLNVAALAVLEAERAA